MEEELVRGESGKDVFEAVDFVAGGGTDLVLVGVFEVEGLAAQRVAAAHQGVLALLFVCEDGVHRALRLAASFFVLAGQHEARIHLLPEPRDVPAHQIPCTVRTHLQVLHTLCAHHTFTVTALSGLHSDSLTHLTDEIVVNLISEPVSRDPSGSHYMHTGSGSTG